MKKNENSWNNLCTVQQQRTILVLEYVEHGEELPVIGNESLTDVLSRADQLLQRL